MPQQQQFNQQPQQQPQQQQLQPRFHLQQQQYTQQHQQLGQNMQPQIQLTHTQPLQQQQYNGGNVQQQNMSQMPPVRAPMPQLGGNTATNSVFPPQQQRQQQQQQQQGFQSQGQTQDQNRPAMSQLGGNALNNSGFPPQQQLGMPQMPTQGGQQMPTQGGQQMPQHGMPPMPNSGFPQAPMKKPMLTMRDVIPPHVKPVDPKYLSVTVNAFPADANVRQRSNLPFGIILRPLAVSPAKSHDEDAIPVVTFPAECKVVRCSSCRSYINPFVTFLDGGARWRCSLCHYNNVTPKVNPRSCTCACVCVCCVRTHVCLCTNASSVYGIYGDTRSLISAASTKTTSARTWAAVGSSPTARWRSSHPWTTCSDSPWPPPSASSSRCVECVVCSAVLH
jgi:protein transport protein SEC24